MNLIEIYGLISWTARLPLTWGHWPTWKACKLKDYWFLTHGSMQPKTDMSRIISLPASTQALNYWRPQSIFFLLKSLRNLEIETNEILSCPTESWVLIQCLICHLIFQMTVRLQVLFGKLWASQVLFQGIVAGVTGLSVLQQESLICICFYY